MVFTWSERPEDDICDRTRNMINTIYNIRRTSRIPYDGRLRVRNTKASLLKSRRSIDNNDSSFYDAPYSVRFVILKWGVFFLARLQLVLYIHVRRSYRNDNNIIIIRVHLCCERPKQSVEFRSVSRVPVQQSVLAFRRRNRIIYIFLHVSVNRISVVTTVCVRLPLKGQLGVRDTLLLENRRFLRGPANGIVHAHSISPYRLWSRPRWFTLSTDL